MTNNIHNIRMRHIVPCQQKLVFMSSTWFVYTPTIEKCVLPEDISYTIQHLSSVTTLFTGCMMPTNVLRVDQELCNMVGGFWVINHNVTQFTCLFNRYIA